MQILAFDNNRFARALQSILEIPAGTAELNQRGDIVYLGVVRVAPGRRLPVVLMMASSRPVAQGLLAKVERTHRQGAVLLTPTDELIDGETESRLADSGFRWLVLADILFADGTKLTARKPLGELVAQPAAAARPVVKEPVHRFPTPPDTEWKDVHIRFTDGHTVTVKVGTVVECVTYAEMNMKHAHSGQPTVLWKLLQAFAGNNGRFDWRHPQASRQIKQRVCRIRKTLKAYFGLTADPFFKYQKGVGYKVRFHLEPER